MSAGESPSTFGNFVGRGRELAELRSALDEASDSSAQMFLVSGEPGIGKTRLAAEIARESAARGMRALWGRCWEGEGAPAYWPWIQVIRGCIGTTDSAQRRAILESEQSLSMVETIAQIVPELRASSSHPHKPAMTNGMNPEQARFQLFDSVTTLLKSFARLQPFAIIIDDLHDADAASLMMLRFVAHELTGARILIVGTYRDLEVRRSPDLSKQIGDLSRDARLLPLTGLSRGEVAKFVALNFGQGANDELVSRIYDETAGNPLFLDGVVQTLIADRDALRDRTSDQRFKTPQTLGEVIRRRLSPLSENARSLLNIAATISNEFDADLWMQVGGVSRENFNSLIDESTTVGILLPIGQARYRFSHALIRGAIYDALDTNTRTRLHGKIAEAIEELRANDLRPHLAELAHHFREAGAKEQAIDYYRRAAKAAWDIFLPADCAANLRQALALNASENDLRRADLLVFLGRVVAHNLNPAEGVAHLEAALEIYRELKNEQKIATANAFLGFALGSYSFGGEMNVPRTLGHLRQAQAWKGEWPGRWVVANLYSGLVVSLWQADRIDEALEVWKQARQFELASNPAWVGVVSWGARLLILKGRHREAAELFDEIAGVLEEMQFPDQFRTAMFERGWCRLVMGDPIEAKRFFTISMERKGLSPLSREGVFDFLAASELLAGDLHGAKLLAAEHSVERIFRSWIAFREGNWEAAFEVELEELEWARRAGHRWCEVQALYQLFRVARVTGDLRRAAEYLAQSLRAYDGGDLLWEMRVRPEAALLAIDMGRPDEANQHLDVCRAIIAEGEDWQGCIDPVERAEGMLAAAEGRDFAAYFERSIANSRRYTLPWEEAETLHNWGVALNKSSEYAAADEKFDAAIEIYHRHGGGQRWIDRVDAARRSPAPRSSSSGDSGGRTRPYDLQKRRRVLDADIPRGDLPAQRFQRTRLHSRPSCASWRAI